jgi:glycosyltransferase involved in cell wall biosynthesis
MKQKKIAYWLNSLDIGGTCKSAVMFAKYLSQTQYKVDFFTYDDADISRKDEILQIPNCDIRYIKRNDPDWSVLRTYDLIHSFRAGGFERPEVGLNVHGPKFIVHNVFGQLSDNRYIEKDIFMSEWLMKDTLQKYNIHDGHSARNRFDFIDNPVEDFITDEKMDLNVGDDTLIVGHISRPDPGLFDGLSTDACKLLLNQGIKIHYLAFSPPSNLVDALKRNGIEHTIIESTIDRPTLEKFYNTIDVLLHDRVDGETGGCCLQEAMMAGKPIVTARAIPRHTGMGVWQNHLEVVQHGLTGLHSMDRNPEEYADWIAVYKDKDIRDDIKDKIRKIAAEKYHIKVGIKKLEKIYEEVLK